MKPKYKVGQLLQSKAGGFARVIKTAIQPAKYGDEAYRWYHLRVEGDENSDARQGLRAKLIELGTYNDFFEGEVLTRDESTITKKYEVVKS